MQIFTEKSIGVSRIRTRIVEVEGEHADHLTTTRPLILFVPAHLWLNAYKSSYFTNSWMFTPLSLVKKQFIP